MLLEKIGFAQGFRFSIARNGRSFPVELTAIMRDENGAGFVSGALNLLKGLPMLAPRGDMRPADQEAMASFQSMSVTREGLTLSIELALHERDLVR